MEENRETMVHVRKRNVQTIAAVTANVSVTHVNTEQRSQQMGRSTAHLAGGEGRRGLHPVEERGERQEGRSSLAQQRLRVITRGHRARCFVQRRPVVLELASPGCSTAIEVLAEPFALGEAAERILEWIGRDAELLAPHIRGDLLTPVTRSAPCGEPVAL